MDGPSDFVASGVPGLDSILGGGLRRGQLYFVEGESGTGKTTLGMQFLRAGLERQESCLLISLAESPVELALIAQSHGWTLDAIDLCNLAEPASTSGSALLFTLSELELDDRVQALIDDIDRLRPQRIMLDSLTSIRSSSRDPAQLRRYAERIRAKASEVGATVLVTDDAASNPLLHPRSLAWGILCLEHRRRDYGPGRRRIWIPKLRGQDYASGYHDFRIDRGGLTVFPRLPNVTPQSTTAGEQISCGIAALDTLLGGGVERGTSMAVIGPPGCGKSTLASAFALAAAGRGERSAFYAFDESTSTFRMRAASQGLPLLDAIDRDLIAMRHVDPAELTPGELACEMVADVEQRGTRLIVIDSLNGYLQAMPNERFMHLHVHQLLSWLASRGVSTLLTLSQPATPAIRRACVDLSFVTDTVIAQRYFETFGVIRYAMSVLKKRFGDHERTIREYTIGAGGIALGEPLTDFTGMLSGVPYHIGESSPLL